MQCMKIECEREAKHILIYRTNLGTQLTEGFDLGMLALCESDVTEAKVDLDVKYIEEFLEGKDYIQFFENKCREIDSTIE